MRLEGWAVVDVADYASSFGRSSVGLELETWFGWLQVTRDESRK